MTDTPDPNDPYYEEMIAALRAGIREAAEGLRTIAGLMDSAAADEDLRSMNATYHMAALMLHKEAERHPRPPGLDKTSF
jgi:hypothetical protein